MPSVALPDPMPPDSPGDGWSAVLLGELSLSHGGVDRSPTAPKVLQLAGLLLTSPGRVVSLDTVVEELWGEHPPRSVRTTVQTYVYHLRRVLEPGGNGRRGRQLLERRPSGYLLHVPRERIDVYAVRALVERARRELGDRPDLAAASLRAALAGITGPPLANVACGPVLSRHVVELEELRRSAQHLCIEAEIAAGAHRDLIGELRALAREAEFDEEVHGQLIRVLACSGRRTEASAAYRDLRRRLVREQGVEPGTGLQSLHVALLAGSDLGVGSRAGAPAGR